MSGVEGKTRRQALTEFREAEILQAARKVFGEHGFAAATVDLIAAEAGIAKGTLYLYFESKDEIFWTAVCSRFGQMLEQTKREVEPARGARAKIEAAVRVRFGFLRSDEPFLRMYFSEFGSLCRLHGPHQQAFRELYIQGAQFMAAVLAAGVEAGELRPLPPLETAMALMDLIRDIFAMRFLGVPGHSAEFDGENFVIELFWNGVAALGSK